MMVLRIRVCEARLEACGIRPLGISRRVTGIHVLSVFYRLSIPWVKYRIEVDEHPLW